MQMEKTNLSSDLQEGAENLLAGHAHGAPYDTCRGRRRGPPDQPTAYSVTFLSAIASIVRPLGVLSLPADPA